MTMAILEIAVTIYEGWLDTDGAFVSDPIIVALEENTNTPASPPAAKTKLPLLHRMTLAVLDQINGARFTDEDQQRRYPGDLFFQYVEQSIGQKLLIGGRDGAGPGMIGDNEDRRSGGGGRHTP